MGYPVYRQPAVQWELFRIVNEIRSSIIRVSVASEQGSPAAAHPAAVSSVQVDAAICGSPNGSGWISHIADAALHKAGYPMPEKLSRDEFGVECMLGGASKLSDAVEIGSAVCVPPGMQKSWAMVWSVDSNGV